MIFDIKKWLEINYGKVKFKTKICEYHKEIIITQYQTIHNNICVNYYDTKEKLFGICFFEFTKRKEEYIFQEMEKKEWYEVIPKDKTKKTTVK